MLFDIIVTLHTSIQGSTRTSVIPFAVGNIKYNILVTLFFQNSVKTLIFEQMPLQFITPHELMLPRFLLLLEKFENIHISHTKKTTHVKNEKLFKSNTSQVIHFKFNPLCL